MSLGMIVVLYQMSMGGYVEPPGSDVRITDNEEERIADNNDRRITD